MKRIIWIYPDRATTQQRITESNIWDVYIDIAREQGFEMSLCAPEDITFTRAKSSGKPDVLVQGQIVTPDNTVFVTSVWSLAHQMGDVANELFLYRILQKLGFYLPIDPDVSMLTTDKYATYLEFINSPIPPIPTYRIGTGRNSANKKYQRALSDLEFPIIIKPAYWGMGVGVSRAANLDEFHGLVGLAGGSNTALVCQPDLGSGTEDFRVYMISGRPHSTIRRSPHGTALTANVTSGGSMEFIDLPEDLISTIEYVHKRIHLEYYSIDFLRATDKFWLSELEPDAAIGFPSSKAMRVQQHEAISARFAAYQRQHNSIRRAIQN